MDQYISSHITPFGFGVVVILSVAALFTSFKAGQLMERSNILDSIHKLELDKRKLQISHKVCLLYKEKYGNNPVPDNKNLQEILEKCVSIDETLPDKILGLNQIYLDLVEHGNRSEYFVQVLQFMFG